MERLLVTKGTTGYAAKDGVGEVAGSWEADLLADGAIAAFDMNGELIDDAGTGAGVVGGNGVDFYLQLGRGSKMPLASMAINKDTLTYVKKVYTAPVKEVELIGHNGVSGAFNFPSPLVVGSIAGIMINYMDRDFPKKENLKRYEHRISTGDTGDTVLAAIALLATNDTTARVTVAVSGTGATLRLTVTAKEFSEAFTAIPSGIIETATTWRDGATSEGGAIPSVALEIGTGTSDAVLRMEENSKAYLGISDTERKIPGMDKYVYQTVDGATYTTYTLAWKSGTVTQSFNKAEAKVNHLMIAVPSGTAALITSLDNILADLTA